MTRTCLVAALAFSVATLAVAAEPKFKPPAFPVDTVLTSAVFSPDGQAATVLFTFLETFVNPGKGTGVGTKTVTVPVHLDENSSELKVKQFIRGFVSTPGNTKASLIVQAAGKTTVVDLEGSADKVIPRDADEQKSYNQAKSQFKTQYGFDAKPRDFNFTAVLDGVVPAGNDYQITFFLVVERTGQGQDEGALLVIDSLDLTIDKAPPAPAKKPNKKPTQPEKKTSATTPTSTTTVGSVRPRIFLARTCGCRLFRRV